MNDLRAYGKESNFHNMSLSVKLLITFAFCMNPNLGTVEIHSTCHSTCRRLDLERKFI